jgi:formamidopyrimidine-DNA glycosylase
MPVDDLGNYWEALRLGPDARTEAFTREWLVEALARRRMARIKPLLLDQRFLAGLGNIYVDESLHRAGIHPERLAAGLTPDESSALYDAIVEILDIAVPIGGAEILNGKAVPDPGAFPFIHGREGAACVQCGATIIKTRVNNRGTYLCTECQPAPLIA